MLSPAITQTMTKTNQYAAVISKLPMLRQLHQSLRRRSLPVLEIVRSKECIEQHSDIVGSAGDFSSRKRCASRSRGNPHFENQKRSLNYQYPRMTNHESNKSSVLEHNSKIANNNPSSTTTKRSMSEIIHGTDLLADSLAHGSRRKIVLESYAPSGVDVKGLIQVGDMPTEGELTGADKIIHMNGSIVAFPDTCFLWNVTAPEEVTMESLSVVRLYQPVVEYLFIGCDKPLDIQEMNKIRREFRKKDIVVEQMDIMNTMGTFNILNGEDRRVACVLVIDPSEESE